MVISKDIHINYPASSGTLPGQLITRTGTLKAEGSVGSEEEMSVRPSRELNSAQKAEFVGKFDNADNIFMEDVSLTLAFPAPYLVSPSYSLSQPSPFTTVKHTCGRASLSTLGGSSGSRRDTKKRYSG